MSFLVEDKDYDVKYYSNLHSGKQWVPYSERPIEERVKKSTNFSVNKKFYDENSSDEDYSEEDN